MKNVEKILGPIFNSSTPYQKSANSKPVKIVFLEMIKVEISKNQLEVFLLRMLSKVESEKNQKPGPESSALIIILIIIRFFVGFPIEGMDELQTSRVVRCDFLVLFQRRQNIVVISDIHLIFIIFVGLGG